MKKRHVHFQERCRERGITPKMVDKTLKNPCRIKKSKHCKGDGRYEYHNTKMSPKWTLIVVVAGIAGGGAYLAGIALGAAAITGAVGGLTFVTAMKKRKR